MHEMSLCESVLRILEDSAASRGFARVKTVWLEIGALTCVEPEAMRFCFAAVTRGSLAEQADLEIINVAGEAWCERCASSVPITQRFDACPECGAFPLRVTDGEQTRVKELEVE